MPARNAAREANEAARTLANDRAFALYAAFLLAGIGCVFTIAVATGIASVPPIAFIVEHVALALGIRAAYKSLDGSNPVVDFLEFYGWKTGEAEASVEGLPAAA